jgi:hypothetical protein
MFSHIETIPCDCRGGYAQSVHSRRQSQGFVSTGTILEEAANRQDRLPHSIPLQQQIRTISGVVSLDAFHVIPHDGETHHTCISLMIAEGEASENVDLCVRAILTQHGIADPATIAISTGTQ